MGTWCRIIRQRQAFTSSCYAKKDVTTTSIAEANIAKMAYTAAVQIS